MNKEEFKEWVKLNRGNTFKFKILNSTYTFKVTGKNVMKDIVFGYYVVCKDSDGFDSKILIDEVKRLIPIIDDIDFFKEVLKI